MLNKKVQDAINDQIQKEIASAYLYLAMSAYFEAENLPGFAHWMRLQYGEELEHAEKFFDFINDRGGHVTLHAIPQPRSEWKSALEAFENVYEHEQKVSASIHSLYEVAVAEKDYPAQIMLHWFIDEQVEEEKNANAIVEQLKRIEAHDSAVLMLDHRLGKRGGED
jgi:ferritin